MKIKNIYVSTDGACSGNPGIGGWSAVNHTNEKTIKIICGNESMTTNNRMELIAVIKAIKCWGRQCKINDNQIKTLMTVYTDSKYVVDCYYSWKSTWCIKDKSNVKNIDLWETIFEITKDIYIELQHVKGHNGDKYNELADKVAVMMKK